MIEEVPINSEEVAETASEVVSEVATPAPKKRGRPAGSKGKPKTPKPPPEPVEEEEEAPEEVAPKRKAAPKKKAVEAVRKKVKKKPVVQSSDSEEEAQGRRAGTREIAMEVMQLLSNQHAGRVVARRQKYAGWFAN